MLLQHLGAEFRVLLLGRCRFPPFAFGLHPGDETEQRSSNDGGDSCQVEGHVVAAQSVPEETCNQQQSGRNPFPATQIVTRNEHQVEPKSREYE